MQPCSRNANMADTNRK